MSRVIVPDAEEIYWISFLTKHGWEPNFYSDEPFGEWRKEGFTRKAIVTKHDRHGYFDREEDVDWFDLEDAYYAQLTKLDENSEE